MEYKEYSHIKDCYVVVHCTGNGVMEDRYVEQGIVYSSNDKKKCERKIKQLTKENNTPQQIKSTWLDNTYMLCINSSSEKGEMLYREWSKKFKDEIEYAKAHPELYDVRERGKMTLYTMKGFVCNEDTTLSSLDFTKSGFIIPMKTN